MKGRHSHRLFSKHKTRTIQTSQKDNGNLNDNMMHRALHQSSSRGPRFPAGGTILICAMAIVLVVVGVIRLLGVFQFTSGQPDTETTSEVSVSQSGAQEESPDSQISEAVGGDIGTSDPEESGDITSPAETPVPTSNPTAEPPAGSPDYVYKYPEMYVEQTRQEEPDYEEKVVYLTFDDGPCSTTLQLLDKLDKWDVKATFFVTGLYGSKEDIIETLTNIHNRGHEIGVHTYSHDYKKIYASVDAFLDDYKLVDDIILEATGERSKIYRFAGGSNTGYNANIRADLIKEMNRRGFVYHDWNASNGDSDGLGTQGEIDKAIADCRSQNRSILLMHDAPGKPQVVDELDSIIPTLQADGYRFAVLDETVKPIQFVKQEPVG